MAMKSTPGVNFINVKHAHFAYKRHFNSFSSYIHVRSKSCQNVRSYKKFVRLTLMKLTTEVAACFEEWKDVASRTHHLWVDQQRIKRECQLLINDLTSPCLSSTEKSSNLLKLCGIQNWWWSSPFLSLDLYRIVPKFLEKNCISELNLNHFKV